MSKNPHLHLKSPPLVEAILGMNYQINPGFSGYLLGRFSERIQDHFSVPRAREGGGLDSRVKLVSAGEDFVLQMLDNGFFVSWVKSGNGCDYPKFEAFLEKFKRVVKKYHEFLGDNLLPPPPLTGLSMGYINRISRPNQSGEAWLSEVFPDLAWRRHSRALAPPGRISLLTSFGFPDDNVNVNVGIEGPWPRDEAGTFTAVKFVLEAKVRVPDELAAEQIWEWFAAAKANLNLTFLDLTCPKFRKEYWS